MHHRARRGGKAVPALRESDAANWRGALRCRPARENCPPPRSRRGTHDGRYASLPRYRRATRGSSDRKSTRLNSSLLVISYAVFCLKKKKNKISNPEAARARNRERGRGEPILGCHASCEQ